MANRRNGRGMMIDEHANYDYHHTDKPEQKAVKEDPWASYYDFAINEGIMFSDDFLKLQQT